MGSSMTATYYPILFKLKDKENSFTGRIDAIMELFQGVVGTIILLEEQLSIKSIAYLIDTSETQVCSMTDLLSPVLDVSKERDSTIKLFHLSFREFLISKSAGEFRFNVQDKHEQVARKCVEILSTRKPLRYNMCQL